MSRKKQFLKRTATKTSTAFVLGLEYPRRFHAWHGHMYLSPHIMEAWPWVPALTTWESGGRSLPISSIKFTRVDKMQRHGDVINVRWSDSYVGSILDLDICAASPHLLAHTRALARVIGTFLICTGRAAQNRYLCATTSDICAHQSIHISSTFFRICR